MLFRSADEDDLAMARLAGFFVTPDDDGMIPDRLSTQSIVDYRAERIGAHDTDRERRLRCGIDFRRPIDELREVVDESGFELVFARAVLRRSRCSSEKNQSEREHSGDP